MIQFNTFNRLLVLLEQRKYYQTGILTLQGCQKDIPSTNSIKHDCHLTRKIVRSLLTWLKYLDKGT